MEKTKLAKTQKITGASGGVKSRQNGKGSISGQLTKGRGIAPSANTSVKR